MATPNLDTFGGSTVRGFPLQQHQQQQDKPAAHPGQQPASKAGAQQQQTPRSGPTGPIDPTKINALSTNYSVAPGPAWIEFQNVQPLGGPTVTGVLPIWGAGDMLGKLRLPLACVIIAPSVPLSEMEGAAAASSQTKTPKTPSQQTTPQAGVTPTASQTQLAAELAGMGVEVQARAIVDDGLRTQYFDAISNEVTTLQANQPAPLTFDEQRLTGMSPSGFPGFLAGLPQASALPSTLGVQGVTIDTTQSPPVITVNLVGTGQVPAFSRWLVFTVTGV